MHCLKLCAQKIGYRISVLLGFLMRGRVLSSFFLSFAGMAVFASFALASDIDRFTTNKLSPNDYLFGTNGALKDPVFDRYKTIDLDVDIGIGSDCGRINIRDTLRAALQNILDLKYLEDMGRDIVAASPMLLTCYFSPTWCSLLKQAQLKASFLAQLRLDQCGAINRFVDQRVSDYYEERSSCIQKLINLRVRSIAIPMA